MGSNPAAGKITLLQAAAPRLGWRYQAINLWLEAATRHCLTVSWIALTENMPMKK